MLRDGEKDLRAFACEGIWQCAENGTARGSLPGAGKSNVKDALRAGADVYITGDIDHHTGIDAAASGMAVIDAGHYGIEHIFIPYMAQYLKKQAPELEIVMQENAEPFQIV